MVFTLTKIDGIQEHMLESQKHKSHFLGFERQSTGSMEKLVLRPRQGEDVVDEPSQLKLQIPTF